MFNMLKTRSVISVKLEKFKEISEKIFKIKDCPYRLAKSFSLGMGLGFLPLPGINIALGVVIAKLLRLNVLATTLAGALLIYVSPFLYVINYKTGAIITSSEEPLKSYNVDYDLSFFSKFMDFISHVGTAYLVGSIMNALIVSLITYFVFLFFLKKKKFEKDSN